MAGIEISDEVTPSQLEAMAGGELLKAEVHVHVHNIFSNVHVHVHSISHKVLLC